MTIEGKPVEKYLLVLTHHRRHFRHHVNITGSWKGVTSPRPTARFKKNHFFKAQTWVPVPPLIHGANSTMHSNRHVPIIAISHRETVRKIIINAAHLNTRKTGIAQSTHFPLYSDTLKV